MTQARASWGLALIIALTAFAGSGLLRDARSERAANRAVVEAAGGVLTLAEDLDGLLSQVSAPGATAGELGQLAAVPEVASAAGLAADTAGPRLSAPFELAGATQVLALSPRYAAGSTPATTAERRARLVGFVVAPAELGRLVDAAFSDVDVVLRDGDVELGGTTSGEPRVASVPIIAGGRTFQVDVVASRSTGLAPSLVLAAGLALAAGILLTGRRNQLASRLADAEATDSGARSALVVEAGAVLHRSLDLGEVLPAVGLQLVDTFGLVGLEILVTGDDGQLDPTFAIGGADGDHVHEVPLERHARTVGALRLRSPRPLRPEEVETLRAIGELAASAIANVHAFAHEQETVRRLAELDELKTDFLATVSHELSTPVTAIKGFSALLVTSWDQISEDQRRDQVARIARNANSLGELVRGLLEFARMERRSLQVERDDHDLTEVVTSVVSQTASLLDDHELVVDAPAPVAASIDPYAVERIVANLLTNAGKFSPPGTPIVVGVRAVGDRAVLTVADRGPGIAPEERAHVFSRFYRGTGQHTVRTRGAGVGLAVVRELVDRMDATITIGDTAGGGSTFTVAFQSKAANNGEAP